MRIVVLRKEHFSRARGTQEEDRRNLESDAFFFAALSRATVAKHDKTTRRCERQIG
jgi:hypothetical protein